MLDQIICIKDLFYCIVKLLSYEDWIHISHLNKQTQQKIKSYIFKNQNISLLFNEKFNAYLPKIINVSLSNPYNFLWDNFKVCFIKKLQLRDLFIEKSGHVSDILKYHSQLFFIDENLIYSSYFIENSSFLPKVIINKYGIKRYENISNLNAFVSIRLMDFDWNKIKTKNLDSIIYVKIWNHFLKSDIILYLFHDIGIKEDKQWIIEQSKSKLKQIIIYHRFHLYPFDLNSYFLDKGDIRIFTNSKFTHHLKPELTGWFLE
jgi:hypothetical protein